MVDGDELVDANAALWTVAVVAQIVLAPTAGAVIAMVGIGWAFAANAFSFGLSAALLCGLRAGRTPAALVVPGWRAVTAGIHAVRAHPLLARLAVVQILAALSAGATSGLLVVLAAERLDVRPAGFGALLAAIGIGAAIGPLVLRRHIRPAERRWLFGPYALRGSVDLTLGAVTKPLVAGTASAAYGVGTSTGVIAFQSTLQTEIPPDVRGRALSFDDVLWNSARLLSLGLGGVLADTVGIRAVYLLGGLLLLAAAAVGWTASLRHPARALR